MTTRINHWAFVGIVSLLIGGCSGGVDGGGSGGSGATGGSGMGGNGTGGGTAGAGGNGTGGTAGTGGMPGTGGNGTGGTAGAGGGSGVVCGGFVGAQCPENEYCDYPDDLCGGADGQGVCLARPQGCPEFYSPTCACNGMVYGNRCEAASAGFDVSTISMCPPPDPNQFNCGHGFCDFATQFCQRTYADVPGTPDSYTCVNLPAACTGTVPSCMCIGDPCGAPIAGMCATAGKGFMVTCPGG